MHSLLAIGPKSTSFPARHTTVLPPATWTRSMKPALKTLLVLLSRTVAGIARFGMNAILATSVPTAIAKGETKMTRFQFLHLRRRRHPVTVAYTICSTEEVDRISLAVCFCSPKDRFDRKRGREIAEARLNKRNNNRSVTLDIERLEDETFNQAVSRQIRSYVAGNTNDIMQRFCIPQQAPHTTTSV